MPARPRLATAAASEVRFPTWDELVAEAQAQATDGGRIEPYQLPLPDGTVHEIPIFSGDQYIAIVEAQRVGNVVAIFETVFPDRKDREKMRKLFRGTPDQPVPWTIIDTLTTKVLRHFYGLSIETEEKAGNSPAS